MNMDAKQFGAELALIVRAAVDPLKAIIESQGKAIAEQAVLIKALEAREPLKGDAGASVTIDDVLPAISEQVAKHLESIPAPKDGEDGKSVVIEDVLPALEKQVADYLAAIPAPKDGEDGKDGIGLAGALIDRNDELVVTLTDGSQKSLGKVVGADGVGKDGLDGLGFDDLDIEHDGERKFTFRMVRGERVVERSFSVPVMIYRQVFKSEQPYQKGDTVTFGGSLWTALDDTTETPGTGKAWQLSVKKGRDGKDFEIKEAPEPKPVRLK